MCVCDLQSSGRHNMPVLGWVSFMLENMALRKYFSYNKKNTTVKVTHTDFFLFWRRMLEIVAI